MKNPDSPLLAISMGEPAGIGGEIILKAWSKRSGTDPFFVIDDPERLKRINNLTNNKISIQTINSPSEATEVFFTGSSS
jgi:4-hydroxythreonine-4-phosphate dehydrogenase